MIINFWPEVALEAVPRHVTASTYVYINMHVCMHACMHACMHSCKVEVHWHVTASTCTYEYVYVCMHACMHSWRGVLGCENSTRMPVQRSSFEIHSLQRVHTPMFSAVHSKPVIAMPADPYASMNLAGDVNVNHKQVIFMGFLSLPPSLPLYTFVSLTTGR
jgi:hypothetical protein